MIRLFQLRENIHAPQGSDRFVELSLAILLRATNFRHYEARGSVADANIGAKA